MILWTFNQFTFDKPKPEKIPFLKRHGHDLIKFYNKTCGEKNGHVRSLLFLACIEIIYGEVSKPIGISLFLAHCTACVVSIAN